MAAAPEVSFGARLCELASMAEAELEVVKAWLVEAEEASKVTTADPFEAVTEKEKNILRIHNKP